MPLWQPTIEPCRQPEEEWLYVHDRIKVRVGKILRDAVRSAEMALRERPLPTDTEGTEVRALEVPVAPSLAVSSVPIMTMTWMRIDVVRRFFQGRLLPNGVAPQFGRNQRLDQPNRPAGGRSS